MRQAKTKAETQNIEPVDSQLEVSDVKLTGERIREIIERRAYELYQQRGEAEGHALSDWLQAVAEVLASINADAQILDLATAQNLKAASASG